MFFIYKLWLNTSSVDIEIFFYLISYQSSFQITEALKFLHNDVKLVHNNICPSAIILNSSGSWKLSGFDFCIRNANQSEQSVSWSAHITVSHFFVQLLNFYTSNTLFYCI